MGSAAELLKRFRPTFNTMEMKGKSTQFESPTGILSDSCRINKNGFILNCGVNEFHFIAGAIGLIFSL